MELVMADCSFKNRNESSVDISSGHPTDPETSMDQSQQLELVMGSTGTEEEVEHNRQNLVKYPVILGEFEVPRQDTHRLGAMRVFLGTG